MILLIQMYFLLFSAVVATLYVIQNVSLILLLTLAKKRDVGREGHMTGFERVDVRHQAIHRFSNIISHHHVLICALIQLVVSWIGR